MLLARTDPSASSHAGLTQFILDMGTPGIEVRPVRQMTGRAAYAEVPLTDVPVPDSPRLGQVNQGWSVSQHTLGSSGRAGPGCATGVTGPIGMVVAVWQASPDKSSPAARALRAELMRALGRRRGGAVAATAVGCLRARGSSGAEASLRKLAVLHPPVAGWRNGRRRCSDPRAPCSRRATRRSTPGRPAGGAPRGAWSKACIASPGVAIAGGTDQIQRNIIGERVTGTTSEPAADRSRAR